MRYTYKDGVSGSKKGVPKSLFWFGGSCLVIGLYIVSLLAWPALPISSAEVQSITDRLKNNQPSQSVNRVYIPKIGLVAAISSQLSSDGFSQASNSGNPVDGGNFILSGNRLGLGPTPEATANRSPLYHVDQLAAGDDIFVDYQGTRYDYKIDNQQTVASNDSSFKTPTTDPTLTIYTRSDGWLSSNRQVIFAHPVGLVKWVDGQPGLKAL